MSHWIVWPSDLIEEYERRTGKTWDSDSANMIMKLLSETPDGRLVLARWTLTGFQEYLEHLKGDSEKGVLSL